MRSLGTDGEMNIRLDFFSTLKQEMLCYALYLKKSISKFTASEAPNRCGTP